MTKLINKRTLILSLLMLLGCACSISNPKPVTPTATTSNRPAPSASPTETEEADTETSAIESSTAARILARNKLLAAYSPDAAPFSYKEEGQAVGFDIDLVREFARRWLGDANAVEFIPVTKKGKLTTIANGEVDLTASAITHKRERDESIDFSQNYYADAQKLLVRKDSGINELEDLDGKRVGGIQETTGLEQIGELAEKVDIRIEVIDYFRYEQAVEALLKGQVDALTSDSLILAKHANQNPELAVVGRPLSQEPYGIGVPQGDSDFRELVDFTLQEMKKDGTYKRIYEQWFPGDTPYPIVIVPGESPYHTLSDFPPQIRLSTNSKIDEILERKKIVAGYNPDAAPFTLDQNGDVVGFDADIVREFARRWLSDETAVEFVPVTVQGRIEILANREADLVASAFTHKRDRDAQIDFSQVYYADAQKLLVRQGEGINELENLHGKRVGAVQDSTSLEQIKQLAQEVGIEIDPIDYLDREKAVQALLDEQVDAVTSDSLLLLPYAEQHPSLEIVGGDLSVEPYGIGLPMNDYRLRELVNFTLQEMKRDGSYDRIHRRWFPDDETPYEIEMLPGNADYLRPPHKGLDITGDIPTTTVLKERKTVQVGVFTDFEPLGFLDQNGQHAGFEIDLIQAMADQWGVEVQFVEVNAANRLLKLESREVDIVAASLTHTKEHEERIDFSQTYFVDSQGLLVRGDSGLVSIEDLAGGMVAVVQDDSFKSQLKAYAQVKQIEIETRDFEDYASALAAVKAGQVDALTANRGTLSPLAQNDTELILTDESFDLAPYALGLPPGDSFFNNLVNFTLQKLKEENDSGVSEYDRIYDKWFDGPLLYIVEVLPGEWPYTIANSPDFLDKPVQSKVDQLLSDCFFKAGVKYDTKPFGFEDEDEKIVGFDVDLVKEFAKRWCGDEEAVDLVRVTSQDRIPKLEAGEVDLVAASMTHKKERDESIDFSQTYFHDEQRLLVHKDSGISNVVDLNLKTVAAITGSTSIDNIKVEAERLEIEIPISIFLEYDDALDALKAGHVDALTTDGGILKYYAQGNPKLVVVGEAFSSEPYGIGVPNYDERFRDLVNFTLQDMKEDGTYDRIYAKWFGDDEPYAIEIWPGENYLEVNTVPMVRIPAGQFIRGRNDGLGDEKPEQSIDLDEFYIDQYEVTNRLYEACVRAGRCDIPGSTIFESDYYSNWIYDKYPVVQVTWEDAADYCNFAGKRLPTEAEWEKAARGADGDLYPWGDEEPTPEEANFDNENTLPIGSHPAGVSPYGVHDMAGNVAEWVADWHQDDYYQNAPLQNPQGPDKRITKVVRGGAWNLSAKELKTTRRKGISPQLSDSNLGFRCASSTFPPER